MKFLIISIFYFSKFKILDIRNIVVHLTEPSSHCVTLSLNLKSELCQRRWSSVDVGE